MKVTTKPVEYLLELDQGELTQIKLALALAYEYLISDEELKSLYPETTFTRLNRELP
jgi:hypothetical protein